MMPETPPKTAENLARPRFSSGPLDLRVGIRLSVERWSRMALRAEEIRRIGGRIFRAPQGIVATDERTPWLWRSFAIIVVVPILASIVYFHFLASNQFVSEMSFAVRGATESLPGSDALASSGMGTLASLNANQDVYIVANYIDSRSMVDDVSKDMDLRGIFSGPNVDWWARFDPSQPTEYLLRYWRNMVQASVEIASGIVTVKVKTFSRGDSLRLATAIRARCDIVVNQLLDRMRRDMIDRAEAEVRIAMDRVGARRTSLEQFRNAGMSIDPLASARSLDGTIAELRSDLIEVEVKLESARSSLGADALQIKMLDADRRILSDQIAALQAKITSSNLTLSTASKALAEYDHLDVSKKLAEKTALLAEKLLDNARAEANRRHIYLVAIQDPTLPEKPLYPKRTHMILIIGLSVLGFWSVAALTVAGVRDHAT